MASRLYKHFTISAGVLASAPTVFDFVIPSLQWEVLSLVFRPGAKGEVGVQLYNGGELIAPSSADQWIAEDALEIVVATKIKLLTTNMTLKAYNSGAFEHTITLKGL